MPHSGVHSIKPQILRDPDQISNHFAYVTDPFAVLPLNQQCKPGIPFETNSEILHFKSSSKRLLQATNTAFKK